MKGIKKKILENGATCYVINKCGYKEKQAVFGVNFGSCYDEFMTGENKIRVPMGTAHFLEHKLFEQSGFNVTERFAKNGAIANAFTNTEQTAYYFSCCENFEDNLETLLKFVSEKAYSEKSIESEKNIIAKEIEMYKDDDSWNCYYNMLSAMYSENKVRNNIAGTLSSVMEIKKEHLDICYDSFYTFDNSVIICCTDTDEEKIYEMIEKNLDLSRNTAGKRILCENDKINSSFVKEKKNLFQTILNLGFKDVQINGTILDRVCLSKILLDIILSKSSDLYEILYNENVIGEEVSYGYNCLTDSGFCYFNTKSEAPMRFRELFLNNISMILKNGIDTERISRIMKKKRGELEISMDKVGNIVNMQLELFSKGICINDIFEYYENISEDKLNERFKALFDPNNSVLSIIE
ncbi:MAG: insulinase family protein [Firmicutes bacterium]|nr:insulinase family protein [Bacillota bacterium]